jgi:uncharacterized surface protein with fasciclin (FAS1) repeats
MHRLLLFGLIIVLVACTPVAAPTRPSLPIATAAPSATPIPSQTAVPSPTPAPSLTPAPVASATDSTREENVADWLTGQPRFSRFAAALERVGWLERLGAMRNVTVLAPTNEAMVALPVSVVQDPALLTAVLLYHILPQRVDGLELGRLGSIETQQGERLTILGGESDQLKVDGIALPDAPVALANGLVFMIGEALQPRAAQTLYDVIARDPRLVRLARLIDQAGLKSTFTSSEPRTVFAPTNEAIDAFRAADAGQLEDPERLRDILLYHVVPGRVTSEDALNLEYNASLLGEPLECTVVGNRWLVNDAEVMLADIPAANGMIHLISELLVPTTSTSNYGP